MKIVTVMVGNIGSGKSTYTKKLQREGQIVISRDALRYSIGAGQYTFDLKYEKVIHKVALSMYEGFLKLGEPIIFDETNMSRKSRKKIISLAKKYGYQIIAFTTKRLSKEVSVRSRLQNNHGTTTKKVWETVWEKFDKSYQEPTLEEGFDKII